MRRLFLLAFAALAALSVCRGAERHFLYMASPDAAQNEGKSGTGVLIFDIDDGHKFVRRIEIPSFQEGIRGFCANAATGRAWYTTTGRLLGCLDLNTDKVLWERRLDAGCDRAAVTPDGRKLYVPTGWWTPGPESGWFIVNAENGDVIQRLKFGTTAHNTVMSLDGSFVLCGTETMLTKIRTSDDQIVQQIKPIGESGVFPMTVNAAGTRAYVCLGKHVGFDIADLTSGTVLGRVLAGDGNLERRTHGAALTPDEKEIWISDQGGKRLYIFDNTVSPPRERASVELTMGGHGWVTFSLDGRYAWCHTPDVIDPATKKIVATLRDEKGKPVAGSKFFEAVFSDSKVVRTGDQFGVGRASVIPR
jgi:hypothetical protein